MICISWKHGAGVMLYYAMVQRYNNPYNDGLNEELFVFEALVVLGLYCTTDIHKGHDHFALALCHITSMS